jgi:membrane peptidoglycan carboxypeptidase
VNDQFTAHDAGPTTIPLRKALSESKRACAYFIGNRITSPEQIVQFAVNFEATHLVPYPSIVMGTEGFSETRLCWAYSTILVRNGFLKKPSFIRRILTRTGEVVFDATRIDAKEAQIVSTKTCKILRQALRESVEEGTSKRLNEITVLRSHDLAAKTGTSRDNLHLGLTGVVDQLTFSLLLQSKGFNEEASKIAVPIAGEMLRRAKLMGRL